MQKHITIPEDHSIAAMFPLLEQIDLNELAASIERNGQRRPIILFQGKIIEGRNRARACALAGVTPRTEEYDPTQHGTSILQLVLDENLHRRHLTPSQRAIIAAEAVKAYQAEAAMRATGKIDPPSKPTQTFGDGTIIEEDDAPAPTRQQLATQAGVSERTMSDALKVVEDPEKRAEVAAGAKSVNQAAAEIDTEKAARTAEAEAGDKAIQAERQKLLKRIRANCGELFAQAFLDGEFLKTQKETAAFMALDNETQTKVAPLIATGWKVAKAASHVCRAITGSSTLDQLVNRAIAEGGSLIFEHAGHEIAIAKLNA